ncbi:MAG: glycosyltransferase family 39 protein [Bacteroidetes bacterium]|nr:glycosyltransferase family 39 protein [Bacteroidota bacterium]
MKFFSPEIYNLISDNKTSGKTAGEFPILYYFIAILWKIFGVHVWIYRFVGLLFVFLGLYSLFRITDYFVKNTFWSIGLSMLLFTSPVFANYGISFITNVSAICIVLAGWWVFLRFYITKKNSFLYFSMLLFLIAGLIKISTLISFIFLFIIFIGERISFFNKKKKCIFNGLKNIIPFILVIIINFAWYYYAERYNKIHGGKYTFNNLWPIWELDKSKIYQYILQIRKNTIYELFNPLVLYSFVFMLLAIILTPKKHPKFFLHGIYILLSGGALYTLLWFQAFDVHDYYYTDLLIVIMFIPLTFFIFIKNYFESFLNSSTVKIIFSLFLLFNIVYCHDMLELRYFPKEKKKYLIIGSQDIPDYFKWFNWNYSQHSEALENIKTYLKSVGIKQEDKIISIPDESINISLYLINQKGFTDFGYGDLKGEARINAFKNAGAKYLIISDTSLLREEYLKPFLEKKIGEYKNVQIFDLQTLNRK